MTWVNAIIQGVLVGGLYALFACGLSLMFGVMKVVNLAHGDLALVAGYVAIGVIAVTHIPVLWSFIIVVPLMAALGYVLQRTILQGAVDRSVLTTLMVTFGLSVVIENGLLQFFTANTRGIGTGLALVTGSFSIGSIQIGYLLVVIFAVAVAVLLGVQVRPPDPRRGRRQGGGAACRGRLPARVRRRGGNRVRHRGAGRHRLRYVLPALPHHGHRHDPAVRVRGRGDRRARLAVGHPARRRCAGRGPADRRPDQHLRRDPCRVHRVPRRARRAPAGPYLPEGAVVSLATETTARSAEKFRVTRSQRNVAWTAAVALIVVVVFAMFPYIVYSGTTAILVQAFIVLTLASMWNLLAGYAGLVSVGQQVFVGLGAYFVLILAINGTSPFAALPVAVIGSGVAALPLWWLVSRLRSGYFAIATWVLATTIMLIIERFSSIGGGTGMPLPGFSGMDPALLTAYTYWAGLAVTVAALAAIYLLLRGRLGLVLTAIRDDEVAARSSGARVGLARMLVFVVAGAGCGAAGAVLAISQLQVQPAAVFSVQWTAIMAFATIIGGLGTIEGPIVGTAVYMVLQQTLASYNAWYLIILGLVAIFVALFARRGLWGLVDERLHLRLFPTGYWLRYNGVTDQRSGVGPLSRMFP